MTPPPAPPAPVPKPPLTGLGILCIVIGALLAVPSGACTGLAAIMMLAEGSDAGEAMSIMLLVLLFAGLPLAGGIALIVVGLKMRQAPT